MENHNGERLELVRAFGELRAGVLVVVQPCTFCGRRHRGLITGGRRAHFIDPAGQRGPLEWGWQTEPPIEHVGHVGRYPVAIAEDAIRARLVYRVVVDEPEAAGEHERQVRRLEADAEVVRAYYADMERRGFTRIA